MKGSKPPSIVEAFTGEIPRETQIRHGLAEPTPDPVPESPAKSPPSPWRLGMSGWFSVAKRTISETGKDRVTAVAGGVTFFGLLALFPAITALVSIYGLFADPITIAEHISVLQRFFPTGALEIIQGQIEAIASTPGSALSVAGIIGLLAALYSANGGMKSLISALNVAWVETEGRGFIRLNLLALGFTLGGIVLIIALIGAITIVPILLNLLPITDQMATWIGAIRWPIMLVVLLLAMAALYRWGPCKKDAKWHWVSPGALLATVGLIAASALFSFYAANFANYNETYGSLGAVVGLMMWLWIAAIVVLVGAELNAAIEHHLKEKAPSKPAGDRS